MRSLDGTQTVRTLPLALIVLRSYKDDPVAGTPEVIRGGVVGEGSNTRQSAAIERSEETGIAKPIAKVSTS